MLSLNSEAEYDSSMSNSYSESESTPIASSDSEDTRSPSPTDLKIPVLYTFDDSHDSVLEVSSSTASNNTDRSPVETSPPILTCVQNQSSCSDQETTSQFKCPGCCKCYLLLYPYKMHVVHCCPDLAPKGLPLTTTEKRKKIVIFSPQYIENLKLMKVQVSAKKRMSKLATISSPASPVISCSISPFNEQQRKSVSPSQSNVEVSKSPGVTSSISNVNTCLTSTSKNSPEKFESNCSNRSNSNNLQDTPLPGRLWSADTPMQLYAKKYFYSDKSRLVRKSDVQESFPRSGESKQHPTTGLLLQAGPEIEEKDKSKLADKSTIPAENVSEDVNDNNAHTSKQTAHQVRVSDSAASDSITAGIEEYSKMEADSKNVSLDSFFWEVIDHLFMKHMDRKKNTKSDQDSSFGTRSISSLIPGFGQTLSYSIPPLEFNQPGGFYCKHQKRVLTGFNNGRRNGWIPNQVVPRFLREAQKLLFKIPSVPARSKVAKKRIAQDVCDVSLTHNVWSSKGKLECNLECTGEKSITAEKRTSLSGVCHSLNPTGGRGEKNLKYFEDEYRRRKYSMDTDDNKCGKTFFAESGQNKSSAPNGKLISNLDKDYRQIVQQLEGPPSPIFADDG
ncbi:unnamed protein product [Allacma fusca]|uniref:Uncharacterized protein n=1 Tax=Allacma fusca TaxID=39272 RepID=A0A8J2LSF1_9HEXA|nr:unnamed protein product [Allacma fusca]